jgi:GAF domain-containing protein
MAEPDDDIWPTDAHPAAGGAALTVSRADSDEADLLTNVAALAGISTAAVSVDDLLTQVATFAARAIPGAEGAGVTMLKLDRPDAQVKAFGASAEFVRAIDEIQYAVVDEGPCITAARERRTVRSGSLGGERIWPRFGPRVGRLGVHSVLSLPLLVGDQVVGAINVYAHAKHAFDDRAAELGELFAVPAAVAVHNAQVLAEAIESTAQLRQALLSRPIIDQAVGLIRGRTGVNAEEAFARLREISMNENTKLVTVAQRLVDDAARRARARRAAGG